MLMNNFGLTLAILILVVLLIFSYGKCGSRQKQVELFDQLLTPEPQDVRISINGGSITVNFTLSIANNEPLPKKFLVVLAQYDNTLKNTGNNKFYLSNEYELNTAISATQTTYQTNLCSLVNGLPACKYVFSNLDTVDNNGNLYYYKLGIAAVYDWGNSKFVIPYNVNSPNNLFTLDTTIENQDNLYNEFIQYKKQKTASANAQSNNMMIATADGQYELIKSQLGNYPSNLILDTPENKLSDLVDKSMVQGILNVNVGISKPE